MRLAFDFRYNKKIAESLINVSSEFLASAYFAKDTLKSWSVFSDNLFSCLELAVKAFLWTTAYGTTFKAKMAHPIIRETFKQFPAELNNMASQVKTLDALSATRYSVRYLNTPINPRWDEGVSWLKDAEAMLLHARNQIRDSSSRTDLHK